MKLVVRTPPIWFYSPKCVEQVFSEVRHKQATSKRKASPIWVMLGPLSIDTLGLNAPVGSAKEGETPMLFVALLKIRGHATFREGVARQMQWDYPEGVRVQI